MRYRGFVAGLLIELFLLQPTLADEYPKVLFGALPEAQEDERHFKVEGNLLQIQMTQTMVLSAGKGALINLFPGPDGGFILSINGGSVIVLELDTDRVSDLPPGVYLIGTHSAIPAVPSNDNRDYKQGFTLADYYMVRQQSYIETLHTSVAFINKKLISLLRNMLPHKK